MLEGEYINPCWCGLWKLHTKTGILTRASMGYRKFILEQEYVNLRQRGLRKLHAGTGICRPMLTRVTEKSMLEQEYFNLHWCRLRKIHVVTCASTGIH